MSKVPSLDKYSENPVLDEYVLEGNISPKSLWERMWCEGAKDSEIPWMGPWVLWANQAGAVAYLSTWVSLPTPDFSLPLTSSSREYKKHKAHGPHSVSLESSEWPRDVKGDLALLSHASRAAQCQTEAAKVNLSLSHPVFRSQNPIPESMSPDLRQMSRCRESRKEMEITHFPWHPGY